MGKHGPCYHCGVTSTPLWRNGPPEKPVLCNACGSRWRTKGTLERYTPLHARFEAGETEDYKVSKAKALPLKNKEAKVVKRKNDYSVTAFGGVPLDYNKGFKRGFDEDASNRSSSGSAISNTESCAQHGSADASDLTGSSQQVVRDSMLPLRKKTCVTRAKPSPVEMLTRDLYTIWHEQQSSCLSASSEEDLLLESDQPMVSVEIGHGSVLIRHPSSIALEEESEASSLSIENKKHTFSSQPVVFPPLIEETDANLSCVGIEDIQKEGRKQRDEDQPEKLQMLAHHNSPLAQDLKGKSVIGEPEAVKPNALSTDSSLGVTRSWDMMHQKLSGAKGMRSSYYEEMKVDEGRLFFSPKTPFCSDFGDESCEHDLLLDVPSNSSFPQAELLPSSAFGAQPSTTSSTSVYPYLVHP